MMLSGALACKIFWCPHPSIHPSSLVLGCKTVVVGWESAQRRELPPYRADLIESFPIISGIPDQREQESVVVGLG